MNNYKAPHGDVAIMTQVHLHRNFADVPFDAGMTDEQAQSNIDRVSDALQDAHQLDVFDLKRLSDMTESARGSLLAHGLITPGLLARAERGAAFVSRGSTLSVMVNDEDHVNIMGIMPGLNIEQAASLCCRADEWLDAARAYACDDQFGYLTADPSCAGSGMTAKVLLHLPALRVMGQISRTNKELSGQNMGLMPWLNAKNEPPGSLNILWGSAPMGVTEEAFLQDFGQEAERIMENERNARSGVLPKDSLFWEDQLSRCLAIIQAAKLMDETEMLIRLGELRTAAVRGQLTCACSDIDQIAMDMRNAAIDCAIGQQPSERDRNRIRAIMLRHAVNELLDSNEG